MNVSIKPSTFGIFLKNVILEEESWKDLRILLEFELWKPRSLWHISGLMNFDQKPANLTVFFMYYSVISVQWFSPNFNFLQQKILQSPQVQILHKDWGFIEDMLRVSWHPGRLAKWIGQLTGVQVIIIGCGSC